jgi:hypothetical protein
MANARPFSISTLQDLSNDTKNTSMRGDLEQPIPISYIVANSKHEKDLAH